MKKVYGILLAAYAVASVVAVSLLLESSLTWPNLLLAVYTIAAAAAALYGLVGRCKRDKIACPIASDSRKYVLFAVIGAVLLMPSDSTGVSAGNFAAYGAILLACAVGFLFSSRRDPLSRFFAYGAETKPNPRTPAPELAEFCPKCGSQLTGRYCASCGHDSLEAVNLSDYITIHTERDFSVSLETNRQRVEQTRRTKPAKRRRVSLDDFPLPAAIRALLWFKNGDEHNLPQGADEPSAIDTKLPIVRDDTWKLVELDYYPAYASLTPGQRAVYLDWLRDIRQHVAIGYVFIFYYGLERHLFTDQYADAVDAILALRKYHCNASLASYSANALAICAAAHRDTDLLEKVQPELNDAAYLWAGIEINGYLTPVDLIRTHRSWGFTNTRYMYGEDGVKDLYFQALAEVVAEHYGQDTIPVDNIPHEATTLLMLANYGMSLKEREHRIPDITASPAFAAQMQGLLAEAHERVKVQLRELRKIQQPKKE